MTTFHLDHSLTLKKPLTLFNKCPYDPSKVKTVYADGNNHFCGMECLLHHRDLKKPRQESERCTLWMPPTLF